MAAATANPPADLGALQELERRQLAGDPAITPEIGTQIKARMDAYRAQGIVKPLLASGADGAKTSDFGTLLDTIDKADSHVGWNTAGLGGSLMGHVSGSESTDLGSTLTTIKANLAFDKLQAMRAASPTGGAVGQVSDTEEKMLSAAVAALDQSQSPAQLRENLANVRKHYAAYVNSLGLDVTKGPKGENIVVPHGAALPGAGNTGGGAGGGGGAPKGPLDPEGVGDIGFADRQHMEANSLPQGAQDFQRQLTDAINSGQLKTADDVVAFGRASKLNEGRGFIIDPKQAQANLDYVKKGGGANVNTPEFPKPDISADRGKGDMAESGKAFIRGIPAVIGVDDELNAVSDTFQGGTLRDNLAKERAIRDYDEKNHFWPREAGSLAATIPFAFASTAPTVARAAGVEALRGGEGMLAARVAAREAFARRSAVEGATVSGAYGIGSSDGNIGDRLVSGVEGAATGAATSYGLTRLGQAAASRSPRLGRLLGIGDDAPPKPPTPGQQVKAAADRLSDISTEPVKVLPADVGGTGTRMATGATASTLGGIPIADAKQASVATLGTARDAVAESTGAVRDTTGAGLAAQRGLTAGMEGMKGREAVLHDVIPIDADRPVVLTNSRDALRYLTAELKSNPKLSAMFPNERMKGFLDALTPTTKPIMKAPPVGSVAAQSGYKQVGTEIEGGTLSWEDMKRFRSIIGNMIGQASLSEDIPTANLRKFYGALSQDMEATAEAAGPKALDAWKKAQRYSRGMHDRIDNVFSEILGDGKDKSGQPAYERFEQWTKAKGGDQAKVGRMLRSMPEDEADSVRATFISRMGQARPGQQDQTGELFSPAEFVTSWNGMDRRAKAAIFNTSSLRSAMDDLATVASGMKGSTKYENFSRTAIGGNLTALGAAGYAAWPLAVLGSAASFGAGKLLSSQWMVRQLTKVASAETSAARQAAVAKFNSNVARNPQFSGIAEDLGKRLLTIANDNGSLTAAASDQKKQANSSNR